MLLNQRVRAFRGERQDEWGTVIRMDGIYHVYIVWEKDNVETHYETSAIILEKYVNKETWE